MLNFIYYPVSAILWFWHKAISFVLPEDNGFNWGLAVVFLVFTLRALLYKPFVHQVRSMRKMQEFAPEIQKLKKKYGNDKQKMAAEMQKLQGEHGVNPLGGCLPVLVQVPVFIGLFQVLREFKPGKPENYVFDAGEVASFIKADLFGAKLAAAISPYGGGASMADYGTTLSQMLVVMIPLMITAGVLTHITARHSIARQTEAQAANPQSAIMNKLMLWIFPIGVVVGAPFLPLAVLLYWVANNLWTLAQQRVVYNKIDAEEAELRVRKAETRTNLAPKVGQKPVPEVKSPNKSQKKPGPKPVNPRPATSPNRGAKPNGAGKPATSAKPVTSSRSNGAVKSKGAAKPNVGGKTRAGGAAPNGAPASDSPVDPTAAAPGDDPTATSDVPGSASGNGKPGSTAKRRKR